MGVIAENIKSRLHAVATRIEQTWDASAAFVSLFQTNRDVAIRTNVYALLQSGPHAGTIRRTLEAIRQTNPALLTPENVNGVIQDGPNAQYMEKILLRLLYRNRSVLTAHYVNNLLRRPHHSSREISEEIERNDWHPQSNFTSMLNRWGIHAKTANSIDRSWTQNERNNLIRFINQLEDASFMRSRDSNSEQSRQRWDDVLQILWNALNIAVMNQSFETTLKDVFHEYTTSCVDRTAVGYVHLEMMTRFHTETNPIQKYRIAVGIQKVKHLAELARTLADERRNRHEELETFLGLLIAIKKEQDIPCVVDAMRFPGCARIFPEDIEKAHTELNKLNPITLSAAYPEWTTFVLENNRQANKAYQKIVNEAHARLATLYESIGEMTQSAYTTATKELQTKRQQDLERIISQATKQLLERGPAEEEKKEP